MMTINKVLNEHSLQIRR